MTYALNLDEPPVQGAVLITLDAMGQCLLRAAQAIEQGESGRTAALEELAILTLLARYVRYRLRERAPDQDQDQERERDAEDSEDSEDSEDEAPPCP